MEPEPGGNGGVSVGGGDGAKLNQPSLSNRSPPTNRPSPIVAQNVMSSSVYGLSFGGANNSANGGGGGGDSPPREAASAAPLPPPAALPHYSSAPNVILVSQFEDLSLSTHSLSSVAAGGASADSGLATSSSSTSSSAFPPHSRAASSPAAAASAAPAAVAAGGNQSGLNNLVIVPNGNGRSRAVPGGQSHGDRLLDRMESFFKDQQLCDVVLIAGDTSISAHR